MRNNLSWHKSKVYYFRDTLDFARYDKWFYFNIILMSYRLKQIYLRNGAYLQRELLLVYLGIKAKKTRLHFVVLFSYSNIFH